MPRKPPTGRHADVAARFAFLLEALELDREGFSEAVDGAVSPRSLFAILAGDRRPSRALAVLVERAFGFRADHLLHGTGPMWAAPTGDDGTPRDPATRPLTEQEQRLVDFARRSVDNARLLEDELARAEAWEAMWQRALAMLANLEHLARRDDAEGYPASATQVLEECWRMAEAFDAWTAAKDRRRVVHLTRLFVERFLVQVPGELQDRGALTSTQATDITRRARRLLDHLDDDAGELDQRVSLATARIEELRDSQAEVGSAPTLADQLTSLVTRIDRLRPTPA